MIIILRPSRRVELAKFYQISSPDYPENVIQDLALFLNEREG